MIQHQEQALGLVEIYHQKIDWKAGQSDKKVTIAYDPMFRAVMNVIQNAVEHTKENGIIYIDAKEQDGRLTFIVEDSGSGFTKEALLYREIFEKYYPGQAGMVVDFWMPNKEWEGCDVDDPSARVLSNYGDSGI